MTMINMPIEKLKEKEIKEIQELWEQGLTTSEIAKQTGKHFDTVKKYGPQTEEPKQAQTMPEPQKVHLQPAPEPQQATPVTPYPEMPEPDEWLRTFLASYRLKEPFVVAQCARVKRRNQLPTPSDLMADLQIGDSGQKNMLLIRDIVEDYDYALDEYLKKRDQLINMPYMRRHGITVDRRQQAPPGRYGGIPMREGYPPYDAYPPRHYGGNQYYEGGYNGRQGIPVQPQQYQQPYQTLEQELDRLARIQVLLGKSEEKSPMMERLEQENNQLAQRLNQLEEERKMTILNENQALKSQINQLSERRRDLEDKIRQLEMLQTQKSFSESDLKYKELEDRHSLEMMKLNEKSKTRETIASAVKTGFSQVGTAIARTAMEMGGGEQKQMEGYTDGKNMWQANCPYCETLITAPLSAKIIKCPGCMRQLEVGSPDEQAPAQPPPQPPKGNTATFTVEQQTNETEFEEQAPKENYITAECPICKTMMKIPPNAKRIACPNCGKKLDIEKTSELPVQPEIKAPVTNFEKYELPPKPGLETQPVETKPETKKNLPDWRTQKKQKKPKETPGLEAEYKEEPAKEMHPSAEIFTKDGYTLFEMQSKSGKPFYFFGKQSEKGTPCKKIPEGYEIGTNRKTGLPILRKKK